MFTNNTRNKIILTIILLLYYSCHLSTALAAGKGKGKKRKGQPEVATTARAAPAQGSSAAQAKISTVTSESKGNNTPREVTLKELFQMMGLTAEAAPAQGSSAAQAKISTVTSESKGNNTPREVTLEELFQMMGLKAEAARAQGASVAQPKISTVTSESKGNKKSPSKARLQEKQYQIIDSQNRAEVIRVQKELQITRAPMSAQKSTAYNIDAIISSVASNIKKTRMNIHQYDNSTSEVENKLISAGSQTVDSYITTITPKSWDIWASGHMGNINQGATNAISANSRTGFYGGSIGIDKIFANNTIVGLALSCGKSNVEHTSKTNTDTTNTDTTNTDETSTYFTVNEKWASNYYQTDIYAHHNFTDALFLKFIAGIGTYGDGTTIGNMFDFSSQKAAFGHHCNATIGYSIFGRGDSGFTITPELGIAYYHLNLPDSIFVKTGSSTFTTLNRFDCFAGLNIKIFTTSRYNIKIIPEITAAVKLILNDKVEGINANNIKLPVIKNTHSNDLSANALATPEQLLTLGGALTATNNNLSIIIHGSFDFAKQYLAAIGSISIKLSF